MIFYAKKPNMLFNRGGAGLDKQMQRARTCACMRAGEATSVVCVRASILAHV